MYDILPNEIPGNCIIEPVRKMWMDCESKIAEYSLMRDLLKDEYLKRVKKVYGYDLLPVFVSEYLKDKSVKNRRRLKSMLDDAFGRQKWDLTGIVILGTERYGYAITFTLPGKQKYCIDIPNYRNITVDNMSDLDNGKYCIIRYLNSYCTELAYSDFDKERIAEYISKLSEGK